MTEPLKVRCRGCWTLAPIPCRARPGMTADVEPVGGKALTICCAGCLEKVLAMERGAMQQFRERDLAGALASYDRALALDPDYPDVLNNVGLIHWARGDLPRGLAAFDRACSVAPEDPELYFNRAKLRLQAGDRRGAAGDGAMMVDLDASALEDRLVRGDPFAQGIMADVVAMASEAIEQSGAARAFYLRGKARQLNGDFEGAERDYAASLERDGTRAEVVLMTGSLLLIRGLRSAGQRDLAGVLARYDQALALRPDFATAYWVRGMFHVMHRDDRVRWLEDFTRGHACAPRNWSHIASVESELLKNAAPAPRSAAPRRTPSWAAPKSWWQRFISW